MPEIEWIDQDRFRVSGVEFIAWEGADADSAGLVACKAPPLLDDYQRHLTAPIPNIVEVGIYGGGSTALLALLCRPRRLVALELSTRPITALHAFIADHGLHDVIRPHLGVDQADRARLAAVVDDEFGGESLDLVIDDASHQLEPTRATFEELFPRLRPGGRYLIEDWSGDTRVVNQLLADLGDPSAPGHRAVTAAFQQAAADPHHPQHALARRATADGATDGRVVPEPTTLARLPLELLLAKAVRLPGIGNVEVTDYWVVVTRDDAPLEPATFRIDLADLDPAGLLRRPG